MKFYTAQHQHTCGVDLHARKMYLCILDQKGEIVLHRNVPARPDAFLEAIEPFRQDLVVGVECMFSWYWLADLCADEGIPFVLGHALYMKAIHGAKAKNDKIDSHKIAALLRGGNFPMGYTYPKEMRATRDLLRRRQYFSRKRAELFAHIRNTNTQYNCDVALGRIAKPHNRVDLLEHFEEASVRESIRANEQLINTYDEIVTKLEKFLLAKAKDHDPDTLARLTSTPGIGKILGMTLLYEIHDPARFPSVQDFASYCRLIRPQHWSAGKRTGAGRRKIGNHHLKWAFSEAAVLFSMKSQQGKKLFDRLKRKHSKGKAYAILSHKLGRAVYYMLKNKKAFHMPTFLNA